MKNLSGNKSSVTLSILEYLKEEGKTNTFKLAHQLSIERNKVLDVIKELEKKGLVSFRAGNVELPAFPKEISKPKEEVTKKVEKTVSKKIRRKVSILEELQKENKQLKEKISELEGTVKKQKPKIITKKIIQKVPVEKIVTRTIIKKVLREKKKPKLKFKKFKFPKFSFMKNIKKLKKPEFVKS